MAVNRIVCNASAEQVYAVLSDPRPYGYFVVGTRTIRRFDPHWPEPGATFDHSLGVGVTLIRDHTIAVAATPPSQLTVHARMLPVAVNENVFRLTPDLDGRVRVELREYPIQGPASIQPFAAIVNGLLWLRNTLALRRLRKVVHARARHQTTAAPPTSPTPTARMPP